MLTPRPQDLGKPGNTPLNNIKNVLSKYQNSEISMSPNKLVAVHINTQVVTDKVDEIQLITNEMKPEFFNMAYHLTSFLKHIFSTTIN